MAARRETHNGHSAVGSPASNRDLALPHPPKCGDPVTAVDDRPGDELFAAEQESSLQGSTLSMFSTLLKLALFCAHPLAALGFTPPTDQAFAVFGNDATKALIKQWSPRPMRVETGSVMLPASTENMQRFVRARILLEDPSVGCVASAPGSDGDDFFSQRHTAATRPKPPCSLLGISLILCRFTGAEHQVILPLWQPGSDAGTTFRSLASWRRRRGVTPARLKLPRARTLSPH